MRRIALLLFGAVALLAQVAISSASKTVATAGTPVTLAPSTTFAKWVNIQALPGNTGKVCYGGSTVSASTGNGTCLTAGQADKIPYEPGFPNDLSKIWIDAAVNGEGVSFTYAQ